MLTNLKVYKIIIAFVYFVST